MTVVDRKRCGSRARNDLMPEVILADVNERVLLGELGRRSAQ